MTRLSLIAAAAAVLALPVSSFADPAPAADPVFDAYRAICVANNGDYIAELKTADATGWKDTQVVPPTDAATSVTDQQAREITVGADSLTLFVNRGLQHMKSGDLPENTCRVETNKPHPGDIDLAKGWLGFAPGGDASLAYWVVTGAPDKLTQVTTSAIPPGGLSIIKVQLETGSAIFVYQHFSPK